MVWTEKKKGRELCMWWDVKAEHRLPNLRHNCPQKEEKERSREWREGPRGVCVSFMGGSEMFPSKSATQYQKIERNTGKGRRVNQVTV